MEPLRLVISRGADYFGFPFPPLPFACALFPLPLFPLPVFLSPGPLAPFLVPLSVPWLTFPLLLPEPPPMKLFPMSRSSRGVAFSTVRVGEGCSTSANTTTGTGEGGAVGAGD